MNTQEITAKYKITRQTLNNWVKKNEIPAPLDKKGRQNVWSADQVKIIDQKINQVYMGKRINLLKN